MADLGSTENHRKRIFRDMAMQLVDPSQSDLWTDGAISKSDIEKIIDAIKYEIPIENIAVHFHDTYGNAINNIKIAINKGITTIDSSVGGLGGCPYAKGAPGNVATEKVVDLLNELNINTGIDMNRLIEARDYILSHIN